MDLGLLKKDVKLSGVGQKEMAKAIRCSQGTVSKMLNNKRRLNIAALEKICEKINLPICRYFTIDELDRRILAYLPNLKESQKKILLRLIANPKLLKEFLAVRIQS